MLKSLKKNQVVIYVIALMLVTAGYLNYTSGDNTITTSADPEITYKENLADIGDAKLVNSDNVNETDGAFVENGDGGDMQEINNEENIENTADNQNDEQVDQNIEQTQTTASNASSDDYFSKSRLDRDTMYSQMLETYQNIVNSSTVSEEQRSMATQEITNINNTKNAIMICENLLGTKGFDKNVIFVNGNSISVVVKTQGELAVNQVAQIQNIVSREMQVGIENITITEK